VQSAGARREQMTCARSVGSSSASGLCPGTDSCTAPRSGPERADRGHSGRPRPGDPPGSGEDAARPAAHRAREVRARMGREDLVEQALGRADTVWIALRPELGLAEADNVMVLRGRFAGFDRAKPDQHRLSPPPAIWAEAGASTSAIRRAPGSSRADLCSARGSLGVRVDCRDRQHRAGHRETTARRASHPSRSRCSIGGGARRAHQSLASQVHAECVSGASTGHPARGPCGSLRRRTRRPSSRWSSSLPTRLARLQTPPDSSCVP